MYVYKFIMHIHKHARAHTQIYPHILTNTLMYTQISKTKLTTTIIQVISIILGR
jgi:hypothetical protein